MADFAPALYVDNGGQFRSLTADQIPEAEGLGWTPATPEQAQAHALQGKYGDTAGEIKAAAAGLARGLTLGGSDLALTKLGLVEPETLKGLEEANPMASGLGEAAGVAAPLLLAGGAAAPGVAARGALRGAAELTAPALAARAGRAITGLTERAIPEAGGMLGQIVSKAAATGAGSAIEGAAYGLGQAVSEAALGDKNLTAQSVLAHMGPMAAIGGGLGGLIGAGEVAVPGLLRKAADSIHSAAVKANEALPAFTERVTGGAVTADQVTAAKDALSKAWTDPRKINAFARDFGDSIEDVVGSVADAQRDFYSQARPFESAALIKKESPGVVKPMDALQQASDAIDGAVSVIRGDKDLHAQAFAPKLEEIRDGLFRRAIGADAAEIGEQFTAGAGVDELRAKLLQKAFAADPVKVFEELRQTRQQLDDLLKWDKGPVRPDLPVEESMRAVRRARNAVRDAITNEDFWGAAAARHAAVDELHADYADALKTLIKGKLSPLNANVIREVRNRGAVEYRLNPRSLRTALNQMGDVRGDQIADALREYLGKAQAFVDGMEDTWKTIPTSNFDHVGLTSLIDKTGGMVDRAQTQATATRLLHDLDPNAGLATGGARALMPPVAPEGAGTGLGALAMAPLIGHMIPGAGIPAAIYGAAKAGISVYKATKNVPQMVATLANLERVTQRISNAIDGAASTLVRGGVKASSVGRAETMSGVAREFASAPEDAARKFQKRVTEIQRVTADPETMSNALAAQSGSLADHAPQTAQALAVASSRALAFLASKVPQAPQQGPLAPEWRPSRAEINKFARYYEAVENPLVVLKQAAAGTITPEAVEAVRAVYPDLYATMTAAIVDKMTDRSATVPYRSRMALSVLLGQPMDGTVSPQAIMANQMVWAAPSRQKQNAAPQATKTTSKGLGRITLSSRIQTPMQASASRR